MSRPRIHGVDDEPHVLEGRVGTGSSRESGLGVSRERRRPRIVFVDDEPNVLTGLQNGLRQMKRHWDMRFFDSAAAALDDLSSTNGAVVVSDWMMPDMDGAALCRHLAQARQDGACYYVVLLTGKVDTSDLVEALDFGADDFVCKPCDLRELVARIRVGIRVNNLERSLRTANQNLNMLATTDPLTDLLNRRKAEEVLAGELERASRGLQDVSVILADLDHFKRINDNLGHSVGDQVLQTAAQAFDAIARGYDSVARWGGEEFLVICPDTNEVTILGVAERMRQAILSHAPMLDRQTKLTGSFGTATCKAGQVLTVHKIISNADGALYEAKRSGRDCVRRHASGGDMDTDTWALPGRHLRGKIDASSRPAGVGARQEEA